MLSVSRSAAAHAFPAGHQAYSSSLFDKLESLSAIDFDTEASLIDVPSHDDQLDLSDALEIVHKWLSDNVTGPEPSGLDQALTLMLQDETSTRSLTSRYLTEATSSFTQSLEHSTKPSANIVDDDVLSNVLKQLQLAEERLLRPLNIWLSSSRRGTSYTDLGRYRSLRQAMLGWRDGLIRKFCSLPPPLSSADLATYMHQLLSSVTTSDAHPELQGQKMKVLRALSEHGASEVFQEALAYATFAVINTYIHSYDMKVDWIGKASVLPALNQWIENCLDPAVRTCQAAIGCKPLNTSCQQRTNSSDHRLWAEMALDSLGHSRTMHLLRYVQMWDQSTGAILDLKGFIRTPEAKRLVVTSLHKQMYRDLLHAGVQTSELLTIYINIIRAFKVLDARNVLLGKVAEPIRTFLATREDTVQVIAASFLPDDMKSSQSQDFCVELAEEVARSAKTDEPDDHKSLDWDDMQWLPDPIDAGPDFEKSKRDDIISYMLRLSDPERFYDKIRRLLCNRLLKSDNADTDQETRLVELLKSRRELDKDKLTECEVMLRDMRESSRMLKTILKQILPPPSAREVWDAIGTGIEFPDLLNIFKDRMSTKTEDSAIRAFCDLANRLGSRDSKTKMITQRQDIEIPGSEDSRPEFSAKILSSVFWPTLRDAQFTVPKPVAAIQSAYEAEFVRYKDMRRLQWLSAQGRATVELHLADRDLKFDSIPAWQASVIYAFQSDNDDPASLSKSQLSDSLQMEDVLLTNALEFWVSQRVLVLSESDTYTVLETLPNETEDETSQTVQSANPAAAASAPANLDATKSQSALLEENRVLYETCIVHMLTNGGAMPADRVAMMLKMVVPGGFEFGEDGVRWLCTGLVESGKLIQDGDTFKIKK